MQSTPPTAPIVNISAYKFVTFDDTVEQRPRFQAICAELALKGTILLSPEGINMFLAGSRTADFNRFIPESMNWGVTITRNPFTLMAKWHHRGEQKRGPSTGQGPLAFVYQDARTTLDLNLTYQASKRISLFINCRNVANVHFNQSRYQADTPAYARRSSANSYGALGSFGLRGTF